MKRFNFLVMLGLIAAASMQAQTTVVSLGFETGDQKYTTADAYTPGGTYGDWINKAEGDVWTEPYAGDKHSGEYSFRMENSEDTEGNTWDRGFKVGNLQLKDNTAYRVSFWVKADPAHFNADGVETANKLKSTLSIGKEYFDMPISTASGKQYYYTWANMTGEWKHFSYVTYFTNKADQDALSEGYSGKTDINGNKTSEVGDPFPDTYFITINMYNPGEYILDDIKLEEGVTFNEATYVDDAIKLDFGYPTNIASLATAAGGTLSLDPSQVTVTVNGEAAEVEYLEGKSDGYLYAFLADGYAASDGDVVLVSFSPATDCPILYTDDRRPSADVESQMQVLGFTGETAYYDETIDAMPSAWSPANMVSSDPENESFEIDGATLRNIAVTYDKELSLDYASATLTWSDNYGSHSKDLSSAMTLSEDGKTINIAVSGLADAEYTLTLSGVANKYGVECIEDQVITFALGEDSDTSVSEEVFATDFDNQMTGGIPVGWITYNEAGYHIYGFNDDGSQYNYNWGGKPGGGGARLYAGFSGDFSKAMYWGTRGTNEGFASFGEQVKDYILTDGTLDPEMPEDIALYLTSRKYQISFLMAAWKGAPQFSFTLEDLDGNVYAKFSDITAAPNVDGSSSANVTGSVKCVTDFTVDKDGYYVLKFTAAEAQWQEYLLANVKLITMPSKAAYYKQQLAAALETAKSIYSAADYTEYDGTTKSAFAAAISQAENGHFTSPTAILELIDQLTELGEKMQARVNNIDDFSVAILEASAAYDELEGKYLNSTYATTAKAMIDQYETTNPSNLSDEELVEVTPTLVTAAAQLKNVKSIVDILSWGAYKAAQTATNLGVDGSEGYNAVTDDREAVKTVNLRSTQALYDKIAAGEDLTQYMTSVYYETGETVEEIPEDNDGEYNEQGYPRAIFGIDFTGLIQNPHFYTLKQENSALKDNDINGWMCTQDTSHGNLHYNGDVPTDDNPVTDVKANNWKGIYDFYQEVENVPVGYYDVFIRTRTSAGMNGQNSEGVWDKYMYVQVGDDKQMTPFQEGASWAGYPTVIKHVLVKDGKIRIGVVENPLSLITTTVDEETGEETTTYSDWETNTFIDDARIFFVAPAEDVDYSQLKVTIPGDVNEDGVVDIKDVVAVINHIAGTDTYANANVNGDKDEDGTDIVDINDVVAIINIMAGN